MWGSCRMNALWTLVAELSGVAWRGVIGGWRGGVSAGWRGGVLWRDVIGGCGLAGSPPRDLLAIHCGGRGGVHVREARTGPIVSKWYVRGKKSPVRVCST